MTLRIKTLLIVAVTLVVLVSVLYGTATAILGDSYRNLERQQVSENVSRAVNGLQTNLDALTVFANDWAHWDDTVSFVLGNFPQFVELNLMEGTYEGANIDWMAFIDAHETVLYNHFYDPEIPDNTILPDGLVEHIQPGSRLLTHEAEDNTTAGFITIPDGIMLIAAAPITDSEGRPPIYGTMIFGRMLADDEVATLATATHLNLTIRSLTAGATPLLPGEGAALDALRAGETLYVEPASIGTISGYKLLDDVYGQPAALLTMTQPRRIYLQGQTSLGYFLLSLLITGMVFIVITLALLERTILKPLSALSQGVETIHRTDNLATHVPVQGKDELSALSLGFNEMVDALSASRTRLQNAHDELDQRVRERTSELTEANAKLEQEIEERKQAQVEQAVARDQALDALRLKTQILANISHDARTPLNIITLNAELIQRGVFGAVTDRQHEKMEDMLISARQLLNFLDNLLGEAQMNRQQMTINALPFDPTIVVHEIVSGMQPLADRRALTLELNVEDDVPEQIVGDSGRLKQVVMNLVDNALKFSDHGMIEVHLRNLDAHYWAVEVHDDGIGITPEAQERIFEAFYQVDGSTTRRANRGVGLGLSIVRQLVTLMKGDIIVTSTPGAGTTFIVRLPVDTTQDEEDHELAQYHYR